MRFTFKGALGLDNGALVILFLPLGGYQITPLQTVTFISRNVSGAPSPTEPQRERGKDFDR